MFTGDDALRLSEAHRDRVAACEDHNDEDDRSERKEARKDHRVFPRKRNAAVRQRSSSRMSSHAL
jgi:hypothetical protein